MTEPLRSHNEALMAAAQQQHNKAMRQWQNDYTLAVLEWESLQVHLPLCCHRVFVCLCALRIPGLIFEPLPRSLILLCMSALLPIPTVGRINHIVTQAARLLIHFSYFCIRM